MGTTIDHASQADEPAIFSLLETSLLPTVGLEAHFASALVAREQSAIVGCAALEIYGKYALLRSVAIAPSHRGLGLGQRLVQAALDLARERGVVSVYLLTETAGDFFPRLGFLPVGRPDIPAIVQTSVEFMSVCPVSALAMVAKVQET